MSERYTRVFALPENLYAEFSPVIISAGALLKDNVTGKVLVQLKIKNISDRIVKAVRIKINQFDVAGEAIDNEVNQEYLDLNVGRNSEFGQKTAITLPDSSTRSFSVVVTEVIFFDNDIWKADGAEWKSVIKPQTTYECFKDDSELMKQYKLDYNVTCKNMFAEDRDLWICSCGNINKSTYSECYSCGCLYETLKNFDMDTLVRNKNERVEEEARIAREKAEEARIKAEKAREEATEKKKRNRKIAVITTLIVCVCVTVVVALKLFIIPTIKYNDALKLMNQSEYENAIVTFEELKGFKDSEAKIVECKYENAVALMNVGKYQEAVSEFKALDGYNDSRDKINECNIAILDEKYNDAMTLMKSGKVIEAYEALIALGDYKDSVKKANSIYFEYKIEKLKTAKVGDYVFFGEYEQDNNRKNGKEEIEWLVLNKKDDKVLVISKYVIDRKPYNTSSKNVTWETCTLRKWLNNNFIKTAFSDAEKEMILTDKISSDEKNFNYNTKSHKTTQDKIFLLSITEANKYFASEIEKQCSPTDYAVSKGTGGSKSYWWLRSAIVSSHNLAAVVAISGDIYAGYVEDGFGVRPAMWIDLNRE